ncbi:MAG: GDP-mannose 4,6-dehydratase [Candidatus Margulisiibacteriota bacterium]
MKRALITGITGQDGAYLAKLLLEKGYSVFGLYRRTSSTNIWRLLSLGVNDQVQLIPGDMTDMASISNAIIQSEPDEIYNLAAQSFVGTSFDQPLVTAQVDGIGVVMLLESAKQINPKIKIYQASTSELYGNGKAANLVNNVELNEHHVFWPSSPYASAKLYSYHQIRIYREAYGIFAVNGILFNHESPLRGLEFVTRKISNAVARIKLGLQKKIVLGNLDAKRDWGYAPEYVEAMWKMLQHNTPDDYVVATGESHTVREFFELACENAGVDPKDVVSQDKKHLRPLDVNCLIGDASKIRKVIGWEPKTKLKELVKLMVQGDLDRWQSHLKGKVFPWDAINDPSIYAQ